MRKLFAVLLVSSTLGISGCGYAANNKEIEAGKTMIDLNNMQNWCVGRYTFKLPKDAKMIDEIINYDSFKIESKAKATRADFDNAVASGIGNYSDGFKLLLEDMPVKQINNKVVKIFWGKLSKNRPTLGTTQVFAYVLDRGTLFLINGSYSEKFKQESRDGVQSLVDNIYARNNSKIPTEQGICFKNGFIKDDGKDYKFTKQKIGFNFATAPSVIITAETEAMHTPEDDLITRTEKNLKQSPNYSRIKNQTKDIRKGTKTINQTAPINGLELVTQVPMEGGTGIIATWEHAGTVKSALDPLVSITVDTASTANYVKTSSIPNHNTLQIYEAILNSLKKF
ncbi:hypothetical protein AMD27_08625 [Acinetobacter sp. TGL-Y2]|nr:hypothetical protein AMD27_08625 [Acinetobacter sp. TGL-Y2]